MKQEISPAIIAAAAVVVVALVGFLVYKVLVPSMPVPKTDTVAIPPPAISREQHYQGGGNQGTGANMPAYSTYGYGQQGRSAPR